MANNFYLKGFSHRKVMQKSPLQYGEIIFQSKVIPLFLPKCSKFHHSEMYTIERSHPFGLVARSTQNRQSMKNLNSKV